MVEDVHHKIQFYAENLFWPYLCHELRDKWLIHKTLWYLIIYLKIYVYMYYKYFTFPFVFAWWWNFRFEKGTNWSTKIGDELLKKADLKIQMLHLLIHAYKLNFPDLYIYLVGKNIQKCATVPQMFGNVSEW